MMFIWIKSVRLAIRIIIWENGMQVQAVLKIIIARGFLRRPMEIHTEQKNTQIIRKDIICRKHSIRLREYLMLMIMIVRIISLNYRWENFMSVRIAGVVSMRLEPR